jgi:hypothetical protein
MLRLERLGEEVGPVVDGLDEGDGDAVLLDELADEEVSPLDVLGFRVKLWVVGDGYMPAWLSIASLVGRGSV